MHLLNSGKGRTSHSEESKLAELRATAYLYYRLSTPVDLSPIATALLGSSTRFGLQTL